MTHERDLDRLLDTWFADGPRDVPDRVIDGVADRIRRQPQRPAWLVHRRLPAMSAPIRLLAVAALVLGSLALGALVMSGGAQPAPATPTPVPSALGAAATASPEPTQSPRQFFSNPAMAAGPYRAPLTIGMVELTLDDGWGSPGSSPTEFSLRRLDGPSDDIVKVFTDMHRSAKDEACTEAPEPGVGTTAAALLADLQADDQLEVSDPIDVTLPGLTGVRVDVRTSPGATRTCPFTEGAVGVPLVVDDIATEGPFWGVSPGELERIYLLDTADGHNVVIIVDSASGESFETLAAAAERVIDTFSFSPD